MVRLRVKLQEVV